MKYIMVVISLLLHCTAVNSKVLIFKLCAIQISMDDCTREGEISLIGSNTTYILAGRMELCFESAWRAVCQGMWG